MNDDRSGIAGHSTIAAERTGDSDHARVARRDVVTEDYRTILNEFALLTTVAVLLFGFLLSRTPSSLDSDVEKWLVSIAITSTAASTAIFLLPVVYHRAQYPYSDWDKFQVRAHRFAAMGLPFLALGLYLSLTMAVWELFEWAAFAIASAPLVISAVVFTLRDRRF